MANLDSTKIYGTLNVTTDVTVGGNISSDTLTLLTTPAAASEATALMLQPSGVVGYRELGSNAFNSTTIPSAAANATITLTAGTNLSGGGNFTTNQSGAETITFNMSTGGAGAATYGSTADNNKIDQITLDAYGRVTAISTGATGDIAGVTAGTGMTGGGTSGTPTLNVIGGDGITANADNIVVDSTVARTNVEEVFALSIGVGGAVPGSTFDNGNAIALGDSDSGIRQNSDGQISLWTNNVQRLLLSTTAFSSTLAISGPNVTSGSDPGHTHTAYGTGDGSVTYVGNGNGMNFTSFSTSGTITMGTPGQLTNATTNSVSTSSHTHAISTLNQNTTGSAGSVVTQADSGSASRPFIWTTSVTDNTAKTLYTDTATTCYINPSTNVIGATRFYATSFNGSHNGALVTTWGTEGVILGNNGATGIGAGEWRGVLNSNQSNATEVVSIGAEAGLIIYSNAAANTADWATRHTITMNANTFTYGGNKIWHAGNDGSGSGLNADLLDGYSTATNTASTVVVKDANNFLFATFLYTSNGPESTTASQYVYTIGDGYHRFKTLANVKTEIVTSAAVIAGLGFTPTANTGDITGVTAGTGLTGGGTSGSVTLNVIGGAGITANANDIAVDSTVVRTTGTQSIGGAKTFTTSTLTNQNITIYGLVDTDATLKFIQGATNLTMINLIPDEGFFSVGGNSSGQYLLQGNPSAGAELHYGGLKKFITTSAGIDVTGSVSVTNANQATISGAMAFRVNNSTDDSLRFCSDTAAIKTWLGVPASSATNISVVENTTTVSINSSTGTNDSIAAATTLKAGVMSNTTQAFNGIKTFTIIRATGDITAYYSDERLKTNLGNITNPLDKINSLNGFTYVNNELANSFGYTDTKSQVGVSAQEVQKVLPETVKLAPFDSDADTNESLSGEDYLTVDYAKLVPLLIEGIKELTKKVDNLENEVKFLKNK